MGEAPPHEPVSSGSQQPDGQHHVTPLPPLPWSGEGAYQPAGGPPPPPEESWYPNVTPPPTRRTVGALFAAGFIVALVLEPLAVYVMSAIGTVLQRVPVVLPFVSMAGLFGPVVVYLVLFLEGRRRLNDRLMSFGKGALFGYFVPVVLLPLIVFGSCFFTGFPN